MRPAILRSGMILVMAAFGASAAAAQTEFSFAAGVDSTGWAQAQSNADGHVLIESPQYPLGLWLHLVDKAGDALAGLQVEYQGRPDSLAAIRCVDPGGRVRETLVLSFEDPNLEKWVLKALGRQEGPITLPEAASLTSLSVSDSSVHSLAGLEHFVALETLSLAIDYSITDVSPLAALTNLKKLSLYFNQLADVSPLAALTNLKKLSLWNNRIADVNPLATLTNLESLNLGANQLADVNPLAALTNLERLYLEDNQITDVSPLAALTNLESLNLKDNQIEDISPLTANTGLGDGDFVNLLNNPLSDQSRTKHIPAL